MGDVRGKGCIMEDAGFKVLECISVSQRMERVVLFLLCVPVEFFELCQVFDKVCHPLMSLAEALYFPPKGDISFSIECKIDHG